MNQKLYVKNEAEREREVDNMKERVRDTEKRTRRSRK